MRSGLFRFIISATLLFLQEVVCLDPNIAGSTHPHAQNIQLQQSRGQRYFDPQNTQYASHPDDLATTATFPTTYPTTIHLETSDRNRRPTHHSAGGGPNNLCKHTRACLGNLLLVCEGAVYSCKYMCMRCRERDSPSKQRSKLPSEQTDAYVRMHICFCYTQFVSPAAFTKKKLPRAFRIGANMKSNVDYEPIIPADCQTDR